MKTTGRKNITCNSRVVLGALLVILSILLLFNNFDILPPAWHSYVFSWQTLLAIVGLILIVPQNTRYIKVVAHGSGPLPQWHLSAGSPSYFFIDEIYFE